MEATPDGWTVGFLAATAGRSAIVDYVMNKHDLTSKERAEILELYCSVLFDKNGDRTSAMSAWKRAMAIRIEHDIFLKKKRRHTAASRLQSTPGSDHSRRTRLRRMRRGGRFVGDAFASRSRAHHRRASLDGVLHPTSRLEVQRDGIVRAYDGPVDARARHASKDHQTRRYRRQSDTDQLRAHVSADDRQRFLSASRRLFRLGSRQDVVTKLLVILLNFVVTWMKIDYVEFDDEWQSRMALIVRLVRSGVVTAVARSSPLHVAGGSATCSRECPMVGSFVSYSSARPIVSPSIAIVIRLFIY